MPRYRSFRDIDWPLLVVTLVICALGVIQIFSATHDTKFHDAWWKQIVWIALGVGLMWLVASIDYHTLLGQVPLFYTVTVGALLFTVAVGTRVFGSKRWISIAGMNLQISEFAKLVIILMVARYLSELKRDDAGIGDLLKLGVLVGIPTLLVMRQPDLGTSLTYLAILGAGILLAGLRWHHLAAIALVAGLSVPIAWPFLNNYQKARLETFVNPYADPRGAGDRARRRARRGAGPVLRRRTGVDAHDAGAAPGRRHLPPGGRRLPRPDAHRASRHHRRHRGVGAVPAGPRERMDHGAMPQC